MALTAARHLLSQGRVLAALGGTVAEAASQRLGLARPGDPRAHLVPGAEHSARVPAPAARPGPRLRSPRGRRSRGLPRAAAAASVPAVGGSRWPRAPCAGLPYPMLKVINGGCRLQINAPLSAQGPLLVRARLQNIDDDGRRAVLHQRVITGTAGAPDALVADLYVVVPVAAQSAAAAQAAGARRAPRGCPPVRASWASGASDPTPV